MSEPQSATLTFREAFRKAGFFDRCVLCLASWFGVGLLPGAPGTFGTLTAVPLVLGLNQLGEFYEGLALIFFIPTAIWCSSVCEKLLNQNDPPEVVIDEVSGFLLTLFLLPLTWLTLCLGFVLFRFFDIAKPFPIRRLERRLTGGTGVVLDDLLAGLYANLTLRVVLFISAA